MSSAGPPFDGVATLPGAGDRRAPAGVEAAPDPPPTPPEKPLPSDCCESGCACCVFDLYAEALADYEARLASWRARHPGGAHAPG